MGAEIFTGCAEPQVLLSLSLLFVVSYKMITCFFCNFQVPFIMNYLMIVIFQLVEIALVSDLKINE